MKSETINNKISKPETIGGKRRKFLHVVEVHKVVPYVLNLIIQNLLMKSQYDFE